MENKLITSLIISALLITTATVIPAVSGDKIVESLEGNDSNLFSKQSLGDTFDRVLNDILNQDEIDANDIKELYSYGSSSGARGFLNAQYGFNVVNSIDTLLGLVGSTGTQEQEKEELLLTIEDEVKSGYSSNLHDTIEDAIDASETLGEKTLSYDDFEEGFDAEAVHARVLWVIKDNDDPSGPQPYPGDPVTETLPYYPIVEKLLTKAGQVSGKNNDGWDTVSLALQVIWILVCAGLGALEIAQLVSIAVGVITAVAVTVIVIAALNQLTKQGGNILAQSLCSMIGMQWEDLTEDQKESFCNSIDNCLALMVGIIAFGGYMAVWYLFPGFQFANLGGAAVAVYLAIPMLVDFIASRFIDDGGDDANPFPIDTEIGVGLQFIRLAIQSILKFKPEAFPILRYLFGQTA